MPRLLLIVGFCFCLTGCPPTKPVSPTSTVDSRESERPPLRVLIMGNDPLIDVIARRWLSISEQRLDIQAMSANEIATSTSIKADVLILESRWLPTFVERGWISPLPKQVLESPADSPAGGLRQDQWPLVWRQSATYGQRLWGIPLGVPMLAIVEQSGIQADQATTWQDRIAMPKRQEVTTAEKDQLSTSDSFLLDRFLVMAASLNPNPDDSGFLFNINSGLSRLHDAWLVEAATLFGLLYSKDIDLVNMPPDLAWVSVAKNELNWALAWPAASGDSSLAVTAPTPWVDTGRGLLAVSASMNRQSATANRFLIWLDEDAQRQEFASHSFAIQPTPDRWLSVSERIDVNRYRELMKHALDDRFVSHELRFAESLPYRQRLIEALHSIIQNPESAEIEFQLCGEDWNRLTAQVGRDVQKKRLAKGFGLEAYRD